VQPAKKNPEVRQNPATCCLKDCLLLHGGLSKKNKPLGDFYMLSHELQWLKVFIMDGPKARSDHVLATFKDSVYLVGG
jgi:hypothetical protein